MADVLSSIANPIIVNPLDIAQKAANLNQTQAQTLQTKIQTDNSAIVGEQELQTLQKNRGDAIAGALGSILADPNRSRQKTLDIIDSNLRNGIFSPQQAMEAKKNINELPDNPEALATFARQKLVQFAPHIEALNATGAPVSMHNVGGADVPLAMPGIANPNQTPTMNGQPVGGLVRTPTFGEANQMVELKEPGTGRPVPVRAAELPGYAQRGYTMKDGSPITGGPISPMPQVMSPSGGTPAPNAFSPANSNQQRLLGLMPKGTGGAPGLGAAPATGYPGPDGKIIPGPSNDRRVPTEQDNALFKENMSAHNEDMRQVNNQGFMAQQQALQTIVNLDASNMGKGAGFVRDAKLIVRDLLPSVAKAIGITNVDDTQMSLKSMARVALAAGNKTDYELLTAQSANPSKEMPLPVAQAVARTVMGLNNMHRAVVNETNAQAQKSTALNLSSQPQSLRSNMMNNLDLNGFTPGLKLDQYVKTLPPKGTPAGDAARAKLDASLDLHKRYSQPNGGSLPNPGGP